MTIQLKAVEQYFHVVQLIMLYNVVSTLKSVDKTLVRDHSLNVNGHYISLFQSVFVTVMAQIPVLLTLVITRQASVSVFQT